MAPRSPYPMIVSGKPLKKGLGCADSSASDDEDNVNQTININCKGKKDGDGKEVSYKRCCPMGAPPWCCSPPMVALPSGGRFLPFPPPFPPPLMPPPLVSLRWGKL